MMNEKKIKVLFIAGNGRSGSTILHNVLGQIDGFCALGELREIWLRGAIKNWWCGCGTAFHDCDFWQEVLTDAYGAPDAVDVQKMYEQTESLRIPHLPLTFLPGWRKKKIERLRPYLDQLTKLYQAIQATTNSRVIIDSSKNPSYGYLLRFIPEIDFYVLHYMRDSLPVSYSWSKKKEFQPGIYMVQKKPSSSAMQWNARNVTAEIFLRSRPEKFMRLRYEDFIEYPQTAVSAILSMLGEADVSLPFSASHTVELNKVNHSVFGNAVRFQNGPVTLRMDNRWRSQMARKDKLAVSALTWPLRLRYGYLQPGSPSPRQDHKRNELGEKSAVVEN
jgi:hypothetical protein